MKIESEFMHAMKRPRRTAAALITSFFLLSALGATAFAQTQKPDTFSPHLDWDEAEIKPSLKQSAFHEVILRGHTDAGVQLKLNSKILWLQESKKSLSNKAASSPKKLAKSKSVAKSSSKATDNGAVKTLALDQLLIPGVTPVSTEPSGNIEIHLRLPVGVVQLGYTLEKGKDKKQFQSTLTIAEKEIKIKGVQLGAGDCDRCVWLGFGMSYLAYNQTPSDNGQGVDYGAFGGPTVALRGRYRLNRKWSLLAAYNRYPAPPVTSSDFSLQKASVLWTDMSAEGEYRLKKVLHLFGHRFYPSLLFGLQYHDMPFLREVASPVYTIDSLKFISGSGGVRLLLKKNDKWYYEASARLQVGLLAQGTDKVSSGFGLAGSIGAIRRITSRWQLGLTWGGQYHNYRYNADNGGGSYKVLSSDFDVSLGYLF